MNHFNVTDIRGVLERADAGDDSAKQAVARNARDWLWGLIATVATDRSAISRLENRAPLDMEAVDWAISLLEIHDGVKVNPNSQMWLARLRRVASRVATGKGEA